MVQPIQQFNLGDVLRTVSAVRGQNLQNKLANMQLRDYERKREREAQRSEIFKERFRGPAPGAPTTPPPAAGVPAVIPSPAGTPPPGAPVNVMAGLQPTGGVPPTAPPPAAPTPTGMDYRGAIEDLYRAGDIAGAQQVEEMQFRGKQMRLQEGELALRERELQRDMAKQYMTSDKKTQDAVRANMEDMGRLFRNVSDEETYNAAVTVGQRRGLIPAGQTIPAYSQESVDQLVDFASGTIMEIRKQELAEKKYQLDVKKAEAKAKAGKDLPSKDLATITAGLRKELAANPYVKGFQDVNSRFEVMQEALKESKLPAQIDPVTGAEIPRTMIAVDQAIITLFNKMTDPSSVVRESEYARTPGDQALVSNIKGRAKKILEGGAGLNVEEREALVRMGKKFFDTYAKRYDKQVGKSKKLAEKMGIDPEFVGIPFERGERTVTGTGTLGGRKVIRYSDGGVEYAE